MATEQEREKLRDYQAWVNNAPTLTIRVDRERQVLGWDAGYDAGTAAERERARELEGEVDRLKRMWNQHQFDEHGDAGLDEAGRAWISAPDLEDLAAPPRPEPARREGE